MTHETPSVLDGSPTTQRRESRVPYVVVAVVALAVIGWGIRLHLGRDAQAAAVQQSIRDFRPLVQVMTVREGEPFRPLTLPGETIAFQEARIYARATGFLAERHVDIGSRVHAGDLLATIAAPDLDQQLAQARAGLKQRSAALEQARASVLQAQSNRDLANVTDDRIAKLAKEGWATLQNADQTRLTLSAQAATLASARANVLAAEANSDAQQATVHQLEELAGFERIVAPFDGVVTDRNVEVGDLINGSASGGVAMFVVQRDDLLRIHVDIPQSSALGVRDGLAAEVTVPEDPSRHFDATVARNAAALKAGSRTLSIEVDVPNPKLLLHPGLFVYVKLKIPEQNPIITLPASAILFNGEGLRVATLDDDGSAQMRDVTIYRDLGTRVELLQGIKAGERVILNAPANLDEGTKVRVADALKDANNSTRPGG